MLFREKIFQITDFWVRNAKSNFFEEKMCLLSSFYKIKVQTISYWSSRLKKHQTLEIWLLSAFVRTYQKSQFPRFFRDF